MARPLRRFLKSEQLESRRPLAADLAALDVNDDMSVTALDALIVINEINRRADGVVAAAEAEGKLDCDTNDDGVVTPIDVLNVVNQINTGLIAVPTDTADGTMTEDVVSVPADSDGNSTIIDTPVNETDVTSPDATADDDSDSTDSNDDTSDDSSDRDDEDVVSEPTEDGSDDSSDDTTDGDESSDGDSSTEDETDCEREQTAGELIHRGMLTIRGHHNRGDLFARLDANGDGALSSDEVPEGLWDRMLEADADASDSITKEELQAYRDAQRVAAVEAFFEQLDSDASGTITSTDVSRLIWRFLSRADADNDGEVTIDELLAVPLPGRWGWH